MTASLETAYFESWSIPYEVFERTELKELSICLDEFDFGNSETMEPGQLKKLQNLIGLNLTGIRISQEIFSTQICTMKNLSQLTLLYADLTDLPDDTGALLQLEKICFRGGQLSTLPDSLAQHTKLTELNLMYNNFKEIPSILKNLPKLKTVRMAGNPLLADFKKFIDQDSGIIDLEKFRNHHLN